MTPTPSSIFESIKKNNPNGDEFWSARDLAKVLEYSEYRNFQPVILKAMASCRNSSELVENHFVHSH